MLLGFSRTIEFTQLTELKFSLNIVMLKYAIQKSGVKSMISMHLLGSRH